MGKYGITEAGDAGLDLSWEAKLQTVDMAVIISKHITLKNKPFLDALLRHKRGNIILHCTCTGYGGTVLEPNVPTVDDVAEAVAYLIYSGFLPDRIVLRTDPVIPTPKGIATAERVWQRFQNMGISRCRYSVLDMYPHVKERFVKAVGSVPFNGFRAPEYMLELVRQAVSRNKALYQFESCAENLPEPVGCISKRDLELLGLPVDEATVGGYQRRGCLCLAGKTELLTSKRQCPSKCLYCYWR